MFISYLLVCSLSLCSASKVKAWRQKRTLAKVLGDKASREPRRWEEDYQLVECEGLFEEYLEMGKYPRLYLKGMMSLRSTNSRNNSNVNSIQYDEYIYTVYTLYIKDNVRRLNCLQCFIAQVKNDSLCCSAAVWVHHHLRGSVPPRSTVRPPQQLGGNSSGRPQVCVRVPPAGGWARPEHRSLVQHTGSPVTPVSHRQRESIENDIHIRLDANLLSTTLSFVLLVFVLCLQAFLIAFTSDFLPRLLYQYKFDNDLNGYVNFTLAYAPLNYTEYPMCRYTVCWLSECMLGNTHWFQIPYFASWICFISCYFDKIHKKFQNVKVSVLIMLTSHHRLDQQRVVLLMFNTLFSLSSCATAAYHALNHYTVCSALTLDFIHLFF